MAKQSRDDGGLRATLVGTQVSLIASRADAISFRLNSTAAPLRALSDPVRQLPALQRLAGGDVKGDDGVSRFASEAEEMAKNLDSVAERARALNGRLADVE